LPEHRHRVARLLRRKEAREARLQNLRAVDANPAALGRGGLAAIRWNTGAQSPEPELPFCRNTVTA